MKQNIKNYLKYCILLFGISITLHNCQKVDEEIYDTKSKSEIRFTYEYQSNQKFNANVTLARQLSKIKSVERNYNKRYISSAEHGFIIDTDYTKYIEAVDGSHHSYTFSIRRENPNELIENLVLTLQDDGTYNTVIVTYYFPDYDTIGIDRQDIDFDSNVIFDDIASRVCVGWYTCVQWNTCECEEDPSCGAVEYNEVCTDNNVEFADAEESDSSGSSSTSSGTTGGNNGSQWGGTVWTSGGTGGMGGDTGSGDNNASGSTTTSSPMLSTPKTPCEKMNKLKADTGFRDEMVELKTAADDENVEKGITLYNKTGVAPLNDKYLYDPSSGTPNNPQINHSYYANTQGYVHTHYEGLISIFSVKDLFDMYNIMKNASVTDDFFYGLITEAGSAYILQIEDRAAFIAFGDANLSNENKRFKFTSILVEHYDVTNNGSVQNNEDGIVKMLHRKNAGLAMFKPTDDTFTDYVKLEYDSGGDDTETNCNEN